MGIQSAILKRNAILGTLGQRYLSSNFPDEFEYYLCAFELVDSNGVSLEYFLFPIMPSQIRERQPQNVNIKRTMSGISTMTSETFNPIQINISGNFGRSFKVLSGSGYIELITNFVDKIMKGNVTLKSDKEEFDSNTKTGYGCTKILERIVNASRKLDKTSNKPLSLIFYNLALNNNYFVKIEDIEFTQDQSSNMIWNYSIQMTAIGKIDDYVDESDKRSNKSLITGDYNREKTSLVISKVDNILNPNGMKTAFGNLNNAINNSNYYKRNIDKVISKR